MVRLFVDTEFNGWMGELLSIAIVSEHGDEIYLVAEEPPVWDKWCFENVFPVLGDVPKLPIRELRTRLRDFLEKFDEPTIVCDWPSDVFQLTRLMLGSSHVDTFFYPCRFEVTSLDIESRVPHNAMADAEAIMHAYLNPTPSPPVPTGLQLTDEQKRAAASYTGSINHGDQKFERKRP